MTLPPKSNMYLPLSNTTLPLQHQPATSLLWLGNKDINGVGANVGRLDGGKHVGTLGLAAELENGQF